MSEVKKKTKAAVQTVRRVSPKRVNKVAVLPDPRKLVRDTLRLFPSKIHQISPDTLLLSTYLSLISDKSLHSVKYNHLLCEIINTLAAYGFMQICISPRKKRGQDVNRPRLCTYMPNHVLSRKLDLLYDMVFVFGAETMEKGEFHLMAR